MSDFIGDLRVLVIGLGSIGVRHLSNLRSLGCRRLGVFRTLNRPPHKALDLDGVAIHDDLPEALGRGYDAVFVCSPTGLHHEHALVAIEAGCHVYVEKPVAASMPEADAVASAARERSVTAAVGCQLRFHPTLIDVSRWVRDGAAGRILAVQAELGESLPTWHPWEDYRQGYAARSDLGGGVVLTQIHEIDYLQWMFGDLQAERVLGGNSGALEIDVEDHMTALLATPDGIPITLHLDYYQHPPCRRLKITGTDAVIVWDYYEGAARLRAGGGLREESCLPPEWERNHLFIAIVRDFLDAIEHGRQPRVTVDDGARTLRIAMAIKEHLATADGGSFHEH